MLLPQIDDDKLIDLETDPANGVSVCPLCDVVLMYYRLPGGINVLYCQCTIWNGPGISRIKELSELAKKKGDV